MNCLFSTGRLFFLQENFFTPGGVKYANKDGMRYCNAQ